MPRIKPFPSLRGIWASSITLPVLNFIPSLLFAAGSLTSSFTPNDLCPTWKPVGSIQITSMNSVRQSSGLSKGNENFATSSCEPFHSSKLCCFSLWAELLFSLEPLFSMQLENRGAEGLPSWEAGILQFQIPSALYFTNPPYLIFIAKEVYYTFSWGTKECEEWYHWTKDKSFPQGLKSG